MTIDKAIDVLDDYKILSAFEATPIFEAALGMGKEALKAVKWVRANRPDIIIPPFAGETETKGGN